MRETPIDALEIDLAPREDPAMPECYFATCGEPAAVEAIGTYDFACGVEQTIALVLCERHAESLRDEVILLTTAA
jgi:hypothetical protein